MKFFVNKDLMMVVPFLVIKNLGEWRLKVAKAMQKLEALKSKEANLAAE